MANDLALRLIGGADYSDVNYAFAQPSLDLQFAAQKSLIDQKAGNNLITFSRASAGTFVNSSGQIQTAVTNYLLRSEEFDNATWGKADASILANATNGPTNQLTADKLRETATTAEHIIWQGRTGSSERVTFSIYAKQAERSRIRIGFSNFLNEAKGAVFDLATGTVIETDTAGTDYTNLGASIISVADGWYRCVFTAQKAAVNTTNNPFVTTVLGTLRNFSGTLGSGVFLWGAQLEQSSTVGEYIPTTSTINSAPRFDHNPTTGDSLGLLVEEQRTNLMLRSEEFGTTWTTNNASISTDSTLSPNGQVSADSLIENTATTQHNTSQSVTTLPDSTVVTVSVYAKSFGRNWMRLSAIAKDGSVPGAFFDLSTGSTGNVLSSPISTSITSVGNGWYRCSVTASIGSGAFLPGLRIWTSSGNGTITYTGDGTSGIYIWGAQLEAGAFPTSYIPTTGTAVTRAADVASITGSNFLSWYRQDEGTFYYEGTISQGLSNFPWFHNASDGTINNSIGVYQFTNGVYGGVVTGGVAATPDVAVLLSPLAGSLAKHALAVKTADSRAALDGTLSTAQGNTVMPVVNSLSIGQRVTGNRMTGHIRRLSYFPQRLSNANLQRITQ